MELDFSWTTGGQPDITHTKSIDRGGFGAVHEVSPFWLFWACRLDAESTHREVLSPCCSVV